MGGKGLPGLRASLRISGDRLATTLAAKPVAWKGTLLRQHISFNARNRSIPGPRPSLKGSAASVGGPRQKDPEQEVDDTLVLFPLLIPQLLRMPLDLTTASRQVMVDGVAEPSDLWKGAE